MTVSTSNIDASSLKINISGVLGNIMHKEFRDAYENVDAAVNRYVVDFSNTSNVDSSGLGMLLLFKDHAGGENANIEFTNCSDHILDIFHVTCFFRLFKIPEYDKKFL